MAIELKMPALSPTMEEGTLAKWLVKEGDAVKAGDIMAEIETDKATMEFEAVDEGTIAKILVAEGTDNVKVGTVIALLAGEGEDASAVAPARVEKAEEPEVEQEAAESGAPDGCHPGYPTDLITPQLLPPGTRVYLCGPPAMVDAARQAAVRAGARRTEVLCERFA